MIGDIVFLAIVYIFFGLLTSCVVLWDRIGSDRASAQELFGVALWFPAFWVKGIVMLVAWLALNAAGIAKAGLHILRKGVWS